MPSPEPRGGHEATGRLANLLRNLFSVGAIEDKITAMGHALPAVQISNPNRTGCVVVGSIIYVSGHGQNLSGPGIKSKGKLGQDLSVEEGYATARAVALAILASLKQELGDLDRISA